MHVSADSHGVQSIEGFNEDVGEGFDEELGRLETVPADLKSGLGDRGRALAAIDENGSLPIAEVATAFRDIDAIAGLASLVFARDLDVDLDVRPGPESPVRRLRA